MYKLFDNDKFFILGHRGCSELFPENTLSAFESCAENCEINGIELDVHLCKSGEVVIAHDSDLKRTANLDLKIEEQCWNTLKDIDVGSFKGNEFSNQRLLLLEDLFLRFSDRFIYDIELKVNKYQTGKKLCLAVWDLIRKYSLEENVMISSFNPFALRRFNKACWYSVPSADIFFNGKGLPKILHKGKGHKISGSSYLKPSLPTVQNSFENRYNMPLIVWTVDNKEDIIQLLELKKKGKLNLKGLIGNNPHKLAKIVKNYYYNEAVL